MRLATRPDPHARWGGRGPQQCGPYADFCYPLCLVDVATPSQYSRTTHLANAPSAARVYLRLIELANPKRVRDFAKGIGLDAKTDPIDAFMISRYREDLRYRCFVMARSESQRLPQDIRQISSKLRVGMKRMSQRTPLVHSEISSTNLVSFSTIFSKPKPESKVRHLHRS